MSTDLDDRLRGLFTELAEATPVDTPSRFQPERRAYAEQVPERPHRATRLVLAGVAAVVVVIVGLVVILQRDETAKVSTSPIPSTDPVLWVPSATSGKITAYQQADEGPLEAGAVRAPDGTVFGIHLNVNSEDGVFVEGESRDIGGHTVRNLTLSTPTPLGVVYRRMSLGCSNLDVTSAGDDPWSADAIALLDGVAVLDGKVRLELPSGWTSFGAAPSRHQFGTSFDVTVDGVTQTIYMFQMPDAPVGFYLANLQTNPEPVDVGETQGWMAETPDGYRRLVAERDGTSFFIAGTVPASKLVEIAKALVRAALADWTTHKDPGTSNETMAPAPAGCQVPSLEILSSP
jgi:hypothetical protein